MSDPDIRASDSGFEQGKVSDENLQTAHASLVRNHSEFNESRSKLPLFLLGLMSIMIFVAAIYMVHHRGGFDPLAYDARFDPRLAVAGNKPTINPVAEGEKLFSNCAVCHQPTGKGVPGVFPPLAGSEWVNGSEERIIRILLNGLSGPVKVEGATYNNVMPAFGAGGSYNWSDDKIAYILTYVRQTWGNTGPAITPETVAGIRGKVGQRKPWAEAELLAVP